MKYVVYENGNEPSSLRKSVAMGQSAEKLRDPAPEKGGPSVINFSNDLVMKLTEGVEPPRQHSKAEIEHIEDESVSRQRLNRYDEMHTEAYGLSLENFSNIVDNLENEIKNRLKPHQVCKPDRVRDCLRKNRDNPLVCADEVRRFADTVSHRANELLKRRMAGEQASVTKLD